MHCCDVVLQVLCLSFQPLQFFGVLRHLHFQFRYLSGHRNKGMGLLKTSLKKEEKKNNRKLITAGLPAIICQSFSDSVHFCLRKESINQTKKNENTDKEFSNGRFNYPAVEI